MESIRSIQPTPADRKACWAALRQCVATKKNRRPGPQPGDINVTLLVRHFAKHRQRGFVSGAKCVRHNTNP